jgi:Reverse transcriptase (RNA-dependent DNA polymerase)
MKKNAAGEVEKYKARLVARGFTQIYGVDFYETYAPVARLSSFRLLLAMANRNGWPADSFDFDSAYLNSILSDDEVIYLEQPAEYTKGNAKGYVFRLRKALYGLKQGARSWYETLRKALEELGFKRTEADHGVFVRRWEDGRFVAMGVHVDDCMAIGTTQGLLNEFKVRMNKKYRLTDLGSCRWLLGIKIERDLEGETTALSQHAYIDSIITRFNFDDLKPSSVPMDPSAPLLKSQCPTLLAEIAKMKNVPYREAVGSLMYAAMGTRPDIAFATSTVAQFMDNPGWKHWEAVKRIFRYLKGTADLKLVYGGKKANLEGFVDADGASQDHRRAISGYVFVVDGGAVSWSSKKQELVTLSTTEAEYVAATHAAKEAVWLRRLTGEIFSLLEEPTTLHGDNKSAIALAHGGQYHARTKHIDIRYHYIRYIIEAGTIKLIYCPTDQQTADILTKALPSMKVKHFAQGMGLSMV